MSDKAWCRMGWQTVAGLVALSALLLAGCGSSGSSSSPSDLATIPTSVRTATQSDPATTPTTSSTPVDTAPTGAASFVVQGSTQEGDKVKVEGRFGLPVPSSQSDVDQTALSECTAPAPDGRELVVRLDLTTTLESSLAGEVLRKR